MLILNSDIKMRAKNKQKKNVFKQTQMDHIIIINNNCNNNT